MKKHFLHLAILLTIFCQLMHALGLCSLHAHDVACETGIETERHAHPCGCGHDRSHHHGQQDTHSDHGQPAPQPNHCGSCCAVESKTVTPPRTPLQVFSLDLYIAPICLDQITPMDRFSHVCVNETLPIPIPLYLSHCTLLI